MRYFVFRNNTVENMWEGFDASYSGYDDISYVPSEVDSYIWFYQVSAKFDTKIVSEEIIGYIDKLQLVYQQIPSYKSFIIFTLVNLYPVRYTDVDWRVQQAIEEFNNSIRLLAMEHSNIKLVDFSEFTDQYSIDQLFDWKYYFVSQMGINPKLAIPFRKWFRRKETGIQLKRKKCLVLDLDNTIWGGILGEDGVEGIQIGEDYPGKAFRYFQEGLVELSKQGIILTICSKNNEADVLEVWEKNPFIVLKRNYISSYRINWQNKADNIKELSQELNLGLDSFVFVDDNPAERELIEQMLPMVAVPSFPQKPYLLPSFFTFLVDTYFHVYSITEEDKQKTDQYRANSIRFSEREKYPDLSQYLESLNIEIHIAKANEFNMSRIAQMTQKTNQFNLTTKRYSELDLARFIHDGWSIFCLQVKDKFGDNGITGAILLKPVPTGMEIDSFLLSCRILGKGIEDAFLRSLLNLLHKQGVNRIYAVYIPTSKNVQVVGFYEKMGFCLIEETEDGCKYYYIDIPEIINVELCCKITID